MSGSSKVSESRFFAALISAWFSLDILNYNPTSKLDRKNVQQATQNEQDGDCLDLKLQSSAENCQAPAPIWASKTIDLTLLAVTRAFDALVVNKYRWFNLSCPESTILTVFSRYADTFVFALSSGTVVCLKFGAIPSRSFTQLDLQEEPRVSQVLTLEDVDLVLPFRTPVQGL